MSATFEWRVSDMAIFAMFLFYGACLMVALVFTVLAVVEALGWNEDKEAS